MGYWRDRLRESGNGYRYGYVVWYGIGIPRARQHAIAATPQAFGKMIKIIQSGAGQGHDFRPLATAAARSATKSAAWSPGGRARTNVPTKTGT